MGREMQLCAPALSEEGQRMSWNERQSILLKRVGSTKRCDKDDVKIGKPEEMGEATFYLLSTLFEDLNDWFDIFAFHEMEVSDDNGDNSKNNNNNNNDNIYVRNPESLIRGTDSLLERRRNQQMLKRHG